MGPLAGVKVVEFAGLVAAPFCTMLLADYGAEIVRIERPSKQTRDAARLEVVNRGRRSIALDLKNPEALAVVRKLVEGADILIEGFRPGVMERLGLGPADCEKLNPRLVYGRMTGWGQDGPYAARAGHDVNYIAVSGALSFVGRRGEAPMPPLGAMGDMSGAIQLALGLVCAYVEASRSGKGQVVDGAMTDASILLLSIILGEQAKGNWPGGRGENMADTGSHFYEVYETSDGGYVSVGAIEPQFYAVLCEAVGADAEMAGAQYDAARWPEFKTRLAALFAKRTRAEWTTILEGLDACAMPVLSLEEAVAHPHNVHRGSYVERAGVIEPGPGVRYSRTPAVLDAPPPQAGEHTVEILKDAGFTAAQIDGLLAAGTVVAAS